jgi:hypothetical protein
MRKVAAGAVPGGAYLVLGRFGVQEREQHVAIAVAVHFVCAEYLAERRRRGLAQ